LKLVYSSKETAQRIKTTAKVKKVSIATLQQDCGLSKNAINQLPNIQQGMDSKSLYTVAEYLNVSTDYLLGRTIVPRESNNMGNGTILWHSHASSMNNMYIGGEVSNESSGRFDKTTLQIAELFQNLDVYDKTEVMALVTKLSKKSV
jgi:hypothetical protein